ncbi:MAG: ankyrin repeat domain-containing protein [Pseudonocardiales bacterium]
MPDLPERPDLDQLRRQAKELLRAAKAGDTAAIKRIRAASDRDILASAQLALAREYGFPSWIRLKTEVERRQIFDRGDVAALRGLLSDHPELATVRMEHWCDHRKGADPLGYLAMLRFDSGRLGLPRDLPAVGEMTRALIAAGAPVEGAPGAAETPLMTAASYGDAEVAKILIDAGARMDATAARSAGGVPGGTPLMHAAVFGMTHVVDTLVGAGAPVGTLAEAAAAGDVGGFLDVATTQPERVAALRLAAGHERLDVIDALLGVGTPVDGVDEGGSTALHEAAYYGRTKSVRHLLARGADPNLRDTNYGSPPLGWCRHEHENVGASPRHDEVEAILEPLTTPDDASEK